MANSKERILIVESDPVISDLVGRQALGSQGFEVKVVEEGATAIQLAMSFAPDVIIVNLELPGLSGKDLMTALIAQGMKQPVIMIAPEGKEKDVIQAFRLGASDYIPSPVREAVVVAAVERAMTAVRARRDRERLQAELKASNEALEKRLNELTTISGVGKAVTSITDQQELNDEIIKASIKITDADLGWLVLLDDRTNKYVLTAHQGLPKSLHGNMNKPWDDGVTSLVAMSGETLNISGDAMEQFKLYSLGKSALVTPVKVGKQTLALLTMTRKAEKPFNASEQAMLEAISDYASISMMNARLFRALDQRASSLQSSMDEVLGSKAGQIALNKQLLKLLAQAEKHKDHLVGDVGALNNLLGEFTAVANEMNALNQS